MGLPGNEVSAETQPEALQSAGGLGVAQEPSRSGQRSRLPHRCPYSCSHPFQPLRFPEQSEGGEGLCVGYGGDRGGGGVGKVGAKVDMFKACSVSIHWL